MRFQSSPDAGVVVQDLSFAAMVVVSDEEAARKPRLVVATKPSDGTLRRAPRSAHRASPRRAFGLVALALFVLIAGFVLLRLHG